MSYPMWNKDRTGILIDRGSGVLSFVESGPEFDALKGSAPDWHEAEPSRPPEPPIEEQRADMWCYRAQGKLAIGPEVWARVVAMADEPDTPWGLKVAIFDTYEWRRLDPNMDALIWAMGLTPEEADDLFRLAMTL